MSKFICLWLLLWVHTVISETRDCTKYAPRYSKQDLSYLHKLEDEWKAPWKFHTFTKNQNGYFNSLSDTIYTTGRYDKEEHTFNKKKDRCGREKHRYGKRKHRYGKRKHRYGQKNHRHSKKILYRQYRQAATACIGGTRRRREYRQMSESDRAAFHQALIAMKTTMRSGMSEYDIFVTNHNQANAPGAHNGAAFLPWHREFLYRFENALRQHNPRAYLPFWDSTLENQLPNPQDSILWLDEFQGNKTGTVTSGDFRGWTHPQSCTGRNGQVLRRAVGSFSNELLIGDRDIERTLSLTTFAQIYNVNDPNRLEQYHGGPHVWVGDTMQDLECSPTDPLFWMHHAFIDLIWELFRQRQTPQAREEYGGNNHRTNHSPGDQMRPFEGLQNSDGLKTHYTRCYQYGDRPVGCNNNGDCGNPTYLWCHEGRCKPKVHPGGSCRGLPTTACYRSTCVGNTCRA